MTDLTSLIGYQFNKDPRIKQATDLLLEALSEHQKKINHVSPPQTTLVQAYQEILDMFTEYRGGKLYFPYIGSGIGNGCLVELLDGSVKYDMISGIGVHYWGHNHKELLKIGVEAALADTTMQGHLQQNLDALELSDILLNASGMNHCFLSSSGAMANENALKIAFQNKHPADRVLAFEHCFMGRTLALAQITDKPSYREGLPETISVDYIPFYDSNHPEESTTKAIETLKKHLAQHPNRYAAMCFELIQGEGGFRLGTREFFLALIKILKEHSILIFIDEVQTFGRTSSLFAYQYYQLEEYVDIVTIGKLSQVCATLFRKKLKPKPGLLSQTFTSSTSALKAGKLIISSLLNDGYLGTEGKIEKVHQQFITLFKKIEKKHPKLISGPYGIGGMIAFTPFSGEFKEVSNFIQDLFRAGVISFIAGTHPSRVRFLIPMGAITEKDIENVIAIVEDILIKGPKN